MKRSRRNHSSKFKARVALEALRREATLAQIASRHGVRANQIGTRRKQLLEHAGEVFDNGSPALDDAERRIRDLRAKVGEVTMARAFSYRPFLQAERASSWRGVLERMDFRPVMPPQPATIAAAHFEGVDRAGH